MFGLSGNDLKKLSLNERRRAMALERQQPLEDNNKSINSVNERIRIGTNGSNGKVSSVYGQISVKKNLGSVSTENGGIQIEEQISGSISSKRGHISIVNAVSGDIKGEMVYVTTDVGRSVKIRTMDKLCVRGTNYGDIGISYGEFEVGTNKGKIYVGGKIEGKLNGGIISFTSCRLGLSTKGGYLEINYDKKLVKIKGVSTRLTEDNEFKIEGGSVKLIKGTVVLQEGKNRFRIINNENLRIEYIA